MADAENLAFWDDPRVEFVVRCIQSTYSKLTPGPKFDKLFQTEATRQVAKEVFDQLASSYSLILAYFYFHSK
jgi:hypothetical protein